MTQGYSKKSHFRRHFIIAKDISTPFLNQLANSDVLQRTVISFFADPTIQLPPQANAINLYEERSGGFKPFDPAQDEISFFHFGIAKSEFGNLQKVDKFNNTEAGKLRAFTSCFLKDKKFTWSQNKHRVSVTQYLSEAFAKQPTPTEFELGVSLSNYVYPVILDELNTTNSFANEYILVTLSDFLTGAKLGNTDDFMRIEEIYHYNASSDPNGTPSLIKRNTEKLKSQFYTLEYFDIPFNTGKNTIAAYFTFIKPIAAGTGSNEYALSIEGNQGIRQQAFHSSKFITNPIKISFSHNRRLSVQAVRLKAIVQGKIVFDSVIAERDGNKETLWQSSIIVNTERNLMQYDSIRKTYTLPSFKLSLPVLENASEKNDVTLTYALDCIYTADNSTPGYIFEISTVLSANQVQYSNPPNKTIMNIAIIIVTIIVAVILLIWLINIGKPTGILIIAKGYTDTFEKTDYDKKGKVVVPYKYWHESSDTLNIKIALLYKKQNWLFNWKPQLKLNVLGQELPKGFDVCLKAHTDAIEQYYTDKPLVISHNGKGEENTFTLLISKTGPDYTLPEPEMLSLTILARSTKRLLLGILGCNLQEELKYSFYVGPDLGKIWVSFDPGTNGSCIAAGLNADDIIIEHTNKGEELITDSKVVLDLSVPGYNKQLHNDRLPAKFYKYGQAAAPLFGNRKRASYQSIKKLLGFTDKKIVHFDPLDGSANDYEVTGKKVSSLLVEGIYNGYAEYISKANTRQAKELLENGQFNPLRAVVAIPNNFTAAKIKEMLGCIEYLNQFKEIRYVYEAEAVLFYYIRNYKSLTKLNEVFTKETILIFDMGGATINATIFDGKGVPNENTVNYEINTIAKLGYGIGGDTIDYSIFQSLFLYADDVPAINTIKIEFENVINKKYTEKEDIDTKIKALQDMCMELKLSIIKNSKDENMPYLINLNDLENVIQAAAKKIIGKAIEEVIIDSDSDCYKMFHKEDTMTNTYLLNNQYFQNLIYNNIKAIIADLQQLSSNIAIDRVIFSGRSTQFPLIKEAVLETFKKSNRQLNYIALDLIESKTAVAKGACLYGVTKDAVKLNNIQTNASFGVKHRKGAEQESVEYIELVSAASKFDSNEAGIRFLQKSDDTESDFAKDNQLVNFYQVMGSNPEMLIKSNEQHKLSKIAAIAIDKTTKKIELRVNENDNIQCGVQLDNGKVIPGKGSVADQEIIDANAEHYTWIVQ